MRNESLNIDKWMTDAADAARASGYDSAAQWMRAGMLPTAARVWCESMIPAVRHATDDVLVMLADDREIERGEAVALMTAGLTAKMLRLAEAA